MQNAHHHESSRHFKIMDSQGPTGFNPLSAVDKIILKMISLLQPIVCETNGIGLSYWSLRMKYKYNCGALTRQWRACVFWVPLASAALCCCVYQRECSQPRPATYTPLSLICRYQTTPHLLPCFRERECFPHQRGSSTSSLPSLFPEIPKKIHPFHKIT